MVRSRSDSVNRSSLCFVVTALDGVGFPSSPPVDVGGGERDAHHAFVIVLARAPPVPVVVEHLSGRTGTLRLTPEVNSLADCGVWNRCAHAGETF